jgi:hypothetical protein
MIPPPMAKVNPVWKRYDLSNAAGGAELRPGANKVLFN